MRIVKITITIIITTLLILQLAACESKNEIEIDYKDIDEQTLYSLVQGEIEKINRLNNKKKDKIKQEIINYYDYMKIFIIPMEEEIYNTALEYENNYIVPYMDSVEDDEELTVYDKLDIQIKLVSGFDPTIEELNKLEQVLSVYKTSNNMVYYLNLIYLNQIYVLKQEMIYSKQMMETMDSLKSEGFDIGAEDFNLAQYPSLYKIVEDWTLINNKHIQDDYSTILKNYIYFVTSEDYDSIISNTDNFENYPYMQLVKRYENSIVTAIFQDLRILYLM